MSAQAIDAALLCEYSQRANGGAPEAAANMVEARALACDDPLTRGVLLLEVARLREQRSDVGGALDALRRAALEDVRQDPRGAVDRLGAGGRGDDVHHVELAFRIVSVG